MKLIDVLVKELDRWPEWGDAIVQDDDCYVVSFEIGSEIKCIDGDWKISSCDPFSKMTLAEDASTAIVTRAQWQEAADQNRGKIMNIEWTGEGLPPVGATVEVVRQEHMAIRDCSEDFIGRTVIVAATFKMAESGCEMVCVDGGGELGCEVFRVEMIQPARTPEQIAAEEIQRIRDEIGYQRPQLGPCPVEQMYLLGYRKFEIVDA